MVYIIIIILLILLYLIRIKLVMTFSCIYEEGGVNIELIGLMVINHKIKIPYLFISESLSLSDLKFKGEVKSFLLKDISIEENLEERGFVADIKKFFDLADVGPNILRYFLEEVNNCDYFSCKSSFGFSNPAYTGIVTGLLWGVEGALVGLMNSSLSFKKEPIFEIMPTFESSSPLKFEIKGIFTLRLVNIIHIGLSIIWSRLSKRREGE